MERDSSFFFFLLREQCDVGVLYCTCQNALHPRRVEALYFGHRAVFDLFTVLYRIAYNAHKDRHNTIACGARGGIAACPFVSK